MSNAIVANEVLAPISGTAAAPSIAFGGSGIEAGNSGNGFYGTFGQVNCSIAGTQVLAVAAGGLTIASGNLAITAGTLTLTSGGLTLTSGNLTLTAGNAVLTLGDLTLTHGNILSTLGNLTLTHGNIISTLGDLTLTAGNALLSSGNLTLTSGNALVSSGNVNITTGYVTLGVVGTGPIIFTNAGVPTDGVTGANVAGPGSLCIDITNKKMYINGNTVGSPTWKIFTSA